MKHFDVAIIGGGMAGLTLLSAIKPAIKQGLSVALIDPNAVPTAGDITSPSFDDRATALSQQCMTALEQLTDARINSVVTDIASIEVSDRGHLGYHLMESQELGHQRFGAVIANRSLGQLLWQGVSQLPVSFFHNEQVHKLQPVAQGHRLNLNSGEVLEARLVVLCDGGRSSLLAQLGGQIHEENFHASARIATVETEHPHYGRAFERFTENGPIALLPFGNFSTLVWTIPENKVEFGEPARVLETEFGYRLGRIKRIGPTFDYPLVQRSASMPVMHNFIALGNAIATLHPVAGQGFNLAIRGLLRASECINRHYCEHATTPGFDALNALAQAIADDQQKTLLFSRNLIRAFQQTIPAVQLGRGLALAMMDRHPLISHSFSLAAMGLLENTPPPMIQEAG